MCHFFVYFLSDDENAALLCAHMKFMKTKGSGCLCTSRLWLKLWSLAALMAEGEGPHGKSWDCTAPRQKKKKKTSLLSFSERQNVALPSFCCLSSRFKIFYLPCSHGEQRHSRKDRTRCSDQYQRPPYGPRLLPSEGMSALCVFVNEREHLCVFFFSSSDLFLICIQSQTIFKDLQMCRCVFREHPPNTV